MNYIEKFQEAVKNEMMMTLATCGGGNVTMRLVSPVLYNDGVLFFTDAGSKKYAQLKENPSCCVSVGGIFAQARAEFFGPTMREENSDMRTVYDAKFKGAFDEGLEFGGRGAEFILLHPVRLSGWTFENDVPTPDGIPNVPFDVEV